MGAAQREKKMVFERARRNFVEKKCGVRHDIKGWGFWCYPALICILHTQRDCANNNNNKSQMFLQEPSPRLGAASAAPSTLRTLQQGT